MAELQLSYLQKTIYTMTAAVALKNLSKASEDIIPVIKSYADIDSAIKGLDSKITTNDLDISYYFTSWDNWNTILDCVWNILKWFPWKAEKADCDDRSNFMTSMCSIIFGLNTCTSVYCEVSNAQTGAVKYLHWCNIVVDDNGSCYLFDADNGGMRQKITTNNCVMGNNKYRFISVRAF